MDHECNWKCHDNLHCHLVYPVGRMKTEEETIEVAEKYLGIKVKSIRKVLEYTIPKDGAILNKNGSYDRMNKYTIVHSPYELMFRYLEESNET